MMLTLAVSVAPLRTWPSGLPRQGTFQGEGWDGMGWDGMVGWVVGWLLGWVCCGAKRFFFGPQCFIFS